MESSGWRTVVIRENADLSCKSECLNVKTAERTLDVPLTQIRTMIINSQQVRLTSYLLIELMKRNICVVFCDEKQMPMGELLGYRTHSRSAGQVQQQAAWRAENKATMWQRIVIAKITNQQRLLQLKNPERADELTAYIDTVGENDISNREAMAARVYFSALFGYSFVRSSNDDTNAALNYGYSILLSAVTRIVAAHGYCASLGIRHCSIYNPYNLCCDLMEPFRPYIDRIVFENLGRELTSEYKKRLIESMQDRILFCGRKVPLQYALEMMIPELLKHMNGEEYQIGAFDFL